MTAPLPPNETERLANLHAYGILDTLPQEEFDDLTAIASQICGTPISLITLVDEKRQWFKSATGLPDGVTETARDVAFCAHALLQPTQSFIVEDAKQDPRFAENELVIGDMDIGFYAGVPLVTKEGYALGSLCVIDHRSRELTADQLGTLERLARQVIKLFELRQALADAEEQARKRVKAYALLKNFSHVIAHDLKAPIRNMRQASQLLVEDHAAVLPQDARSLIQMIETRAVDASRMIEGVLRFSKETHQVEQYETVDIAAAIDHVMGRFNTSCCEVHYCGEVSTLTISRIGLEQTLQNLLGNAIKFCDKPICRIVIDCRPEPAGYYTFTVHDNGPGVLPQYREAVFRLFHTLQYEQQQESHGVGLTIAQHLVEVMGGSIALKDTTEGALFSFTLPVYGRIQ